MNDARTIAIDRIALTLEGVDASDARLLAVGLGPAMQARLATHDGEEEPATDSPLVTALRGQAFVDAVAARLVSTLLTEGESSWH